MTDFAKININYDPQKQGYSTTIWKNITSAPTISGTNLRFTSAIAVQYADVRKGNFTFNITIPTAPTAGHSRSFGLMNISKNVYALFNITHDVFRCITRDEDGNTKTTVVTWNTDWSATATNFTVRQIGFDVVFSVNGAKVARHEEAVPRSATNIYVLNGVADNMDLASIVATDVETYIV